MNSVTAKLVKLVLVGETIVLIFSLLFGYMELTHRITNKASLLADSIRNDFLLNDQKSLFQKIQIATISHDFSEISVTAGPEAYPNSTSVLVSEDEIPIFAIPSDRNSSVIGRVIFKYSVLPGILNGLILWFVISIALMSFIPFIKVQIQETLLRDLENRKVKELNEIAVAVAHDIRSPLSALNSIIYTSPDMPTDSKKILSQVSVRINSIANDLLTRGRYCQAEVSSANTGANLKEVLEKVRREKSLEYLRYPSVNISLRMERLDSSVCANIPEGDLSRILSNLINNSVEAIRTEGEIIIQAHTRNGRAIITVLDTGDGIPEEVLKELLKTQISTKAAGSGVGLYSAFQTLAKYGGDIEIRSKLDIGTEVTLGIPLR